MKQAKAAAPKPLGEGGLYPFTRRRKINSTKARP
jgi:hypothetical protein